MALNVRISVVRYLIFALPLLLSGCFATPSLEGITSQLKGDLGYKIELHESQAPTTDSLPILFNLVFDQKVNLNTLKPANLTNSGTAGKINFEIVNSGDNKNFAIKVHSVASIGTVIPKLDLSGIYLEKGLLKKEHSLVQVDYQPSEGLFKALDKFQPVDKKGYFKPIGEYKGQLLFLKDNEIYSVTKDFGSEQMLSDGTGLLSGYHHTIVNDKVIFLTPSMDGVTGSYFPVAFDLTKKQINQLGVVRSGGFTMYKKMGCSSLCAITTTYNKAYVFYPLDANRVLFNADDGVDAAVFVTDGTQAGTQKIKALRPTGNLDSFYYGNVGNNIYFAQDMDGGYDRELFVTDGTEAGTKQISGAKIDSHTNGWDNMVVGDRFYFENDTDSRKAWYTIGDAAAVKETKFDNIYPLLTYNSKIYATNNKELIRMDTDFSNPETLTSGFNWIYERIGIGNYIYFIGNKTFNGAYQYLWRYDPSDSSITQITSSRTEFIDRIGNTLILNIDDPTTGKELYSYVSGSGVSLLKDINPGTDDSSFGGNFLFNSKLYVYINNDLYQTDGTPSGTLLHTDLPSWASTTPKMYKMGGGIFLEHSDFDHNNDLFYFDGSDFLKISELATGYSDLDTKIIGINGDKLAFSLKDRRYGETLWFTDSSLEGTTHFGSFTSFQNIGSKSFVFSPSMSKPGLDTFHETDFTKSGTVESTTDLGLNASQNASYFKHFVRTKDYDFVVSHNSVDDSYALFSIHLTTGAIERLINLDTYGIDYRVEGDNTILFVNNYKLYYSEGTAANTYKITPDSYSHSMLTAFRLFGSEIYYSAANKIYKATIGTDTAVEFINTSNSPHTGTDIGYLELLGDNLVFSSGWVYWTWYTTDKNTASGTKLHEFSTGSKEEVSFVHSSWNPKNHRVGNTVLFANPEDELWLSDGGSSNVKIGNGYATTNVVKSGGKLFIFNVAGLIITDGTNTSAVDTSYASNYVKHSLEVDTDKFLVSVNMYTENKLFMIDAGVITEYGSLPKASVSSQDAYFLGQTGDYVFFRYSSPESGAELWGLNLVSKKYLQLTEIGEGINPSNPASLLIGTTKIYIISGTSYKNDMIWSASLTTVKDAIDNSSTTFP
jgi:ELWxxDGT repeat protein